MNKALASFTLIVGLAASGSALACGGESSGKHIGYVTAVNANANIFTLHDMETQHNITFTANDEIIGAVQRLKGNIMVDYEENDEGSLEAVNISF